jgi:hypothetical protein
LIEVNVYILAESTRVVVPDSFGITEGCKNNEIQRLQQSFLTARVYICYLKAANSDIMWNLLLVTCTEIAYY